MNFQVPRQPPPSSVGDTETMPDGLLAYDTIINDTRTVVTADNEEVHHQMSSQDEDTGTIISEQGMEINLAFI